MKRLIVVTLAMACLITASIAFIDIVSFSQTTSTPVTMLGIGCVLVGLESIGQRFG